MGRISRLVCILVIISLLVVVAASCTEYLSLSVTRPVGGIETITTPIKVYGSVSDKAATITVNGTPAEVTEYGSFTSYVDLVEGENTITVIATTSKKTATKVVTIKYTPKQPVEG